LSIILSVGMIIFKPSYPSCVNHTLHTSHVTMGSGQSKSGLGWSAIAYSPIEPKSLEHQ